MVWGLEPAEPAPEEDAGDKTGNDWRQLLVAAYPRFFERGGFPSVGDGWRTLLERALARITLALGAEPPEAGVSIVQIKEKFGTLRLYYHARSVSDRALAAIEEAVELAEARSACTCEQGGDEGGLYVRGDWYVTCCREHAQGEPVPVKPGSRDLRVVQTYKNGKLVVASCRRYDRPRDRFVAAPLPPDFSQGDE
jgi:hypothetical protein